MKPDLHIKNIHAPPSADDGARVLVDRIWPRGVSKQSAALTLWLKDIAPTTTLRKWFNHEPARWEEFCRRYHRELDESPSAVGQLREIMKSGRVTLVYGAHDTVHNNAAALREYLMADQRNGQATS
jgi:uncharacterized protein YeaO (DUF488 family)